MAPMVPSSGRTRALKSQTCRVGVRPSRTCILFCNTFHRPSEHAPFYDSNYAVLILAYRNIQCSAQCYHVGRSQDRMVNANYSQNANPSSSQRLNDPLDEGGYRADCSCGVSNNQTPLSLAHYTSPITFDLKNQRVCTYIVFRIDCSIIGKYLIYIRFVKACVIETTYSIEYKSR